MRPLILPHFQRQLHILAKRFRNIEEAVFDELEIFDKRRHDTLGSNLYKMRLASKDIQRGKSEAFRMIVLALEIKGYLIPVTIYFKGDQADILKRVLIAHVKIINQQLPQ